jgi:NAD(P)H-hydrate repair Nnr-like enzyme with NAD(P)H-hydrate dehydratase domain
VKRTWTIYADHDCYGDGVTATEALALAHAERDAVLRRWPETSVTVVVASGERPTTDDPEIEAWVDSVWQEILSTGGNGDYIPRVLARWADQE